MEGGGRARPQGGQLVFAVSVVAPRQRPAARWEGGGPEGQTGALEGFHHAFGENRGSRHWRPAASRQWV